MKSRRKTSRTSVTDTPLYDVLFQNLDLERSTPWMDGSMRATGRPDAPYADIYVSRDPKISDLEAFRQSIYFETVARN